eukprot:m.1399809 g.1399809  ORF g.1399809 m.1399809 type:complete len:113 (-) comp25003_c0_seq15:209-547(-)
MSSDPRILHIGVGVQHPDGCWFFRVSPLGSPTDCTQYACHVHAGVCDGATGIFPKNRYIEETVEASTPDGAMPERSNAREGMLHNLAARAMSGNMDITTPARQPRAREPALD